MDRGYRRGVAPRARVLVLTAVAALAAAGGAVGVTLLTTRGERRAAPEAKPRPGVPPLALDLGVRVDREAQALRRATRLHNTGRREEAAVLFARYGSLEARVGAAFSSWPDGTVERLNELASERPGSALVRLHLGLALFWARRDRAALAAWREAERVQPDTPYAVRADTLLHPGSPEGLPLFVPGFGPPPGLERLRPDRQLAALEREARGGGARARLLYGVALQRLGRPRSAERAFAAAAAVAPDDPEAQVAAAVGRFDKDAPERAFSRLGPLARRFPRASTVRFHLGLLLLWLGRVDAARGQLRRAVAVGPKTPLAREAKRFLERLGSSGTGGR
jgi:tetratricopeptide (TPR) repeat protein